MRVARCGKCWRGKIRTPNDEKRRNINELVTDAAGSVGQNYTYTHID